jgi:hypothetical protein
MASTQVAVTQNTVNGAVQCDGVTVDKTNGNKLTYSRNSIYLIQETGGSASLTVTATSNPDSYGKVGTVTIVIPLSKAAFIGPLDADFSRDGFVELSFTGTGVGKIFPVNFVGV